MKKIERLDALPAEKTEAGVQLLIIGIPRRQIPGTSLKTKKKQVEYEKLLDGFTAEKQEQELPL